MNGQHVCRGGKESPFMVPVPVPVLGTFSLYVSFESGPYPNRRWKSRRCISRILFAVKSSGTWAFGNFTSAGGLVDYIYMDIGWTLQRRHGLSRIAMTMTVETE